MNQSNDNFDDIFRDDTADGGARGGVAGDEMSRPRGARGRAGKKKRPLLWVVSGLGVLVLLLVAAIGGYALYVRSLWDKGSNKIDSAQVFGPEAPPDAKEGGIGTNILLLGSDSRSEDVDYTTARGFRSDTIMVAHIPADGDGMQIVSIPRDSWVEIDGHGSNKINAAMSFGGLPLATKTISDFIGAPIHHVAIIDFEGFQDLSTALGGVEVEAVQDFSSNGSSFTAGTNTVEGKRALDFVRARKNFSDGDYTRIRHQQSFIKGALRQMLSKETLTNPGKVADIVEKFSPYVTVDNGLDSGKATELAYGMRNVRASDVQFFTVPNDGPGRRGAASVIVVNEKGLEDMQKAFAEDTVGDFANGAKNGVWS